jgi:hypothetical protein
LGLSPNGKNPEKGRNLFENFGTDSLLILIFGLLEMFSITLYYLSLIGTALKTDELFSDFLHYKTNSKITLQQ